MPCGGCGKRRTQSNQVRSRGVTMVNGTCPVCKMPLRKLHSYDRYTKKVVAKLMCMNDKCRRYKK